MGVRGLTTYINFKENVFLKTFLLHDSYLVIDGHSLCAQLYRSLNCFSAFGGDYDKFAFYVKTFFKNLRKCNITAYVLFDGSYESRKLKTAYSRLRSKIHGASRLDPVTQGGLQIFPMLLRDVFKEIVKEMEIPYTICEFEADDEIAAMARHLNCPVLSYDSDFFIYNVLYIPFNTLDFKPTIIEEKGEKVFVLECKIYKVEHLTKHFGGLKEEMLPLLATLLGNDYVEKKVFSKFFSQLKLPKSRTKKNEQQRCIHGLFNWLQNETLDSAISKILGRLKKKQKHKVLAIMKKSIEGYYKTHCRSLEYFNIACNAVEEKIKFDFPDIVDDDDQFANEDMGILDGKGIVNGEQTDSDNGTDNEKQEDIKSDENNSELDNESFDEDNLKEDSDIEEQLVLGLPEWFAKGIRQYNIPHSFINLYTHSLHFCSPQAEDYTDEDSFLCTLPILRYAFDIMCDYSRENFIYVSREKDNAYRRILVDQEFSIQRPFDMPFQDLSDDQLKSCFNHFVKEKMPLLDISLVNLLPSNFQVLMLSLLWWVAKCDVPLGNVHSLLISYVMLEVIDEKTGTFRGHFHFNNKYAKKIQEFKTNSIKGSADDTELFLNKNKVQYEDCIIAASTLLKHFELDDKIKKKPKSYDIRKIHSFAQFQCCLSQFNNLNQLCRTPFEGTKYSKCYNGTFVYNIAVKLENQIDPVSFFEQYLKDANTVLRYYKSLCHIYTKCIEIMGLVNKKWEGKKRRRRKNNIIDEELNFIVKGFESEVVI